MRAVRGDFGLEPLHADLRDSTSTFFRSFDFLIKSLMFSLDFLRFCNKCSFSVFIYKDFVNAGSLTMGR